MDRLTRHSIGYPGCRPVLLIVVLQFALSSCLLYAQGPLVISGGSVVNAGNLILAGDLINNGAVTDNSGTMIFTGTTQSIEGANPIEFNNISLLAGNTTTLNTAGQTLKGILLTDGTLNTNDYLTLLSTAAGTALIDGGGTGTVNGNITMQRYLSSGFGYKYFSSPFQAATVSEFGDDMDLLAAFHTFYSYDESLTTSGWVSYVTPTNILNPMEGYAVNFGAVDSPNTVDVTGQVTNGPVSATLFNNNNTYTLGFNLVGNPYPSPIDWDAVSGWTKTNIDDAIYYFNASSLDQYGGNYNAYINGVSSDGNATNIIPSMQGVFVHVTDGTFPVTATLGMDNSVRINDLTHGFLKSGSLDARFLVRLSAGFSDVPGSPDKMVVYFDNNATPGFDSQFDALKLMNTDVNVPNLYAFLEGRARLSINALPAMIDSIYEVPMGIITYRSGEIVFSISDFQNSPSSIGIFLKDEEAGTLHDMLSENQYVVNLNEGVYDQRFSLLFAIPGTLLQENIQPADIFTVHAAHGLLKGTIAHPRNAGGQITVFDLVGRAVYSESVLQNGSFELDPQLKTGIYIINYSSLNVRESKKIFFHER